MYRSSRGNKLDFRITREAILQNHIVNDIAALDTPESPKDALPIVALKIGTDFRGQVSSAPRAALLNGCLCGHSRCLGKHGVHVNLLFMVSNGVPGMPEHAVHMRKLLSPAWLPPWQRP